MMATALTEFLSLRPVGGFDLIMADPPWSFQLFSEKGEAKAPQAHYDVMGLDALAALPVEALAGRDCLLWLWACNPLLPQAFDLMAAWGFSFCTAGTWIKRTTRGKIGFGTGYVLRSANEPFLIGRRGKPVTTRATRSVVATHDDGHHCDGDWPSSTITIEAVAREHSRKPDEAFLAAESLMPDAQRLELFSRQSRPGWVTWGREAGKFDDQIGGEDAA